MIKQIKYDTTTSEWSENLFGEDYANVTNVTAIGIQGPADLIFTLDGTNEIRMNRSQLFELNLNGVGTIGVLQVKNPNGDTIYIDIVYSQNTNIEEVPLV